MLREQGVTFFLFVCFYACAVHRKRVRNKEEARAFDLKGNALCRARDCSIRHAISNKNKKKTEIGARDIKEVNMDVLFWRR